MMQLLAEVARAPAFPDSEVKLAQANALQGLKAAEAQPGFKARRALAQAVYGDHPYGHPLPTEEATKAVPPQQFPAAHARRFRSEGPQPDLQSLMRTPYAVFGLKNK